MSKCEFCSHSIKLNCELERYSINFFCIVIKRFMIQFIPISEHKLFTTPIINFYHINNKVMNTSDKTLTRIIKIVTLTIVNEMVTSEDL